MPKIFHFQQDNSDGGRAMIDTLGNKGAHLCEMSNMSIPVPPGFVVPVDYCLDFYQNNKTIVDSVKNDIRLAIKKLENTTGKQFGGVENPLLVSVRSGSRFSMPGMMDTVLNVGLTKENMASVARSVTHQNNNASIAEWFALDLYRRFFEMYSSVVLGISSYLFEEIVASVRTLHNINHSQDLSIPHLEQIIDLYSGLLKANSVTIPSDPYEQLFATLEGVFLSWTNRRAQIYREIHNIPQNYGTAVNIQSMVFGNSGTNSATGVVFSRNPMTGDKHPFGEYLINAQGEDVVSGVKTPHHIWLNRDKTLDMSVKFGECTNQLMDILRRLEVHYKSVQDVEFTIENGKLWILQTRSAKKSAMAMVKIACDMFTEGLLTKQEAINSVDATMIQALLHPSIVSSETYKKIATGIPVSPGVAIGAVVFSAERAESMFKRGTSVILVREETSPEDISGMHAAVGILTAKGGATSHAAVVARGMGKSCVSGCDLLMIDVVNKQMSVGEEIIREGDVISIDGNTGDVILGSVDLSMPEFTSELKTMIQWCLEEKKIAVRANAETAKDASVALDFGANGIGLCRTEHMFFNQNRIHTFRRVILHPDGAESKDLLALLEREQYDDFVSLFQIAQSLPINIRLLDPPLHEFLPSDNDVEFFANFDQNLANDIKYRLKQLKETNPMLGHRGIRLGVTWPAIYEMQIRAIFQAYLYTIKSGINPNLEIMLPLVNDEKELLFFKDVIESIKIKFEEENSLKIQYKLGIMIETPRACILADKLSPHVDYFSFGTNDLTQAVWALSRDDAVKFWPSYQMKKIINFDPFVNIDVTGVGYMMSLAISKGLQANPKLIVGVCGEHGGDPKSIVFFKSIGVHYVSCSPYRIPASIIISGQGVAPKRL